MNSDTLASLITSIVSLLGVIVTVVLGNKSTNKQLQEHDELLAYKIQKLEEKQDKHNSIIERMFKAEDRLDVMDEKIKVANKRIKDLEDKK